MVDCVARYGVALLVLCLLKLSSSDTVHRKHTSFHHLHRLQFSNTLKLLEQSMNLIYQRYEFNNTLRFQFFLGSSNMPLHAWNIVKYKIAKKILQGNSTFLMVFGGSSVTAGHDNYFNQSYPMVVERRMSQVFASLGIKLRVHNIAQGASNCRPSNFCYGAMGGDNADFIGWEQSYNCGRDKGIFELIARVAYFHKAVVYYSASGAFSPDGCAPSVDPIPWISEEWTPEKSHLNKSYNVTIDKVEKYRQTLHNWFEQGNSAARFAGVYGHYYNGVGPHGFSVWTGVGNICINDIKNKTGCSAIEVLGPCQHQGGAHWMVQEGSYFGKDDRRGSNWHPPVGMHLMRGEILAYNYLHIVMDAMSMVERDLNNKSYPHVEDIISHYGHELNLLQIPIPENPLYCSFECKYNPICYTNYEPNYNPSYLLKNLIVGNHTGWKWTHKPYQYLLKYGYLDRKPYLEAKGSSLEIYFQIFGTRSNCIRVCGFAATKDSLKHAIFLLDPNVTIVDVLDRYHQPIGNDSPLSTLPSSDHHRFEASLNYSTRVENSTYYEPWYVHSSEYIPTAVRYVITKRKYAADECTLLSDIPFGNHVLTVRTDPKHPDHPSSVSHLIIF